MYIFLEPELPTKMTWTNEKVKQVKFPLIPYKKGLKLASETLNVC